MDSFSCQNEEQYNEKARTSTRREREREGGNTHSVHQCFDRKTCHPLDETARGKQVLLSEQWTDAPFPPLVQACILKNPLLLFYHEYCEEKCNHVPKHSAPSQDEIMEHAFNSGIPIKAICIVVRRHDVTNCWHDKKWHKLHIYRTA